MWRFVCVRCEYEEASELWLVKNHVSDLEREEHTSPIKGRINKHER